MSVEGGRRWVRLLLLLHRRRRELLLLLLLLPEAVLLCLLAGLSLGLGGGLKGRGAGLMVKGKASSARLAASLGAVGSAGSPAEQDTPASRRWARLARLRRRLRLDLSKPDSPRSLPRCSGSLSTMSCFLPSRLLVLPA
jgi:hypothetical protein